MLARTVTIQVHFDAESNSYWANSPDVDGLVVSGPTIHETLDEAASAASSLIELETAPAASR